MTPGYPTASTSANLPIAASPPGERVLSTTLLVEASRAANEEPLTRRILDATLLCQASLTHALAPLLARKPADDELGFDACVELSFAVLEAGATEAAAVDLLAIHDRDLAAAVLLAPFHFFQRL